MRITYQFIKTILETYLPKLLVLFAHREAPSPNSIELQITSFTPPGYCLISAWDCYLVVNKPRKSWTIKYRESSMMPLATSPEDNTFVNALTATKPNSLSDHQTSLRTSNSYTSINTVRSFQLAYAIQVISKSQGRHATSMLAPSKKK